MNGSVTEGWISYLLPPVGRTGLPGPQLPRVSGCGGVGGRRAGAHPGSCGHRARVRSPGRTCSGRSLGGSRTSRGSRGCPRHTRSRLQRRRLASVAAPQHTARYRGGGLLGAGQGRPHRPGASHSRQPHPCPHRIPNRGSAPAWAPAHLRSNLPFPPRIRDSAAAPPPLLSPRQAPPPWLR